MLFYIQNDLLRLSTVGNADRMLRSDFLVVCKCPGGRATINYQMSAPGTHRVSNARGLLGGGCSRLELTRTLLGAGQKVQGGWAGGNENPVPQKNMTHPLVVAQHLVTHPRHWLKKKA